MSPRRRLLPDRAFPQDAFVPGRGPHPLRDVGHAYQLAQPMDDRSAILFGVDLFNHGYFWEAHEAWEGPWRAAAQSSDRRLFLKALIRLAAAALKLRQESAAGVRAHAPWAARTFLDLARRNATIEGLSPRELHELAYALGEGRLRLDLRNGMAQPSLEREIVPSADAAP